MKRPVFVLGNCSIDQHSCNFLRVFETDGYFSFSEKVGSLGAKQTHNTLRRFRYNDEFTNLSDIRNTARGKLRF